MKIEFSGAPEGTVYADILGKIDRTDESYSDFNFIPNEPLSTTRVWSARGSFGIKLKSE